MMQILSNCSASLSELQENPTALLNEAEGSPIAILNDNKPAAYFIGAETFERLMEELEDSELSKLVIQRQSELDDAIAIDINEL